MVVITLVGSYILLSIIGSLSYVGILLLFLMTLKKIFNMNEDKWSALFKFDGGKGMFFMLVFPYLIMLIAMFPISMLWFEFINFDHKYLGSITIIILLTLTFIFKLPKLKKELKNKYQASN